MRSITNFCEGPGALIARRMRRERSAEIVPTAASRATTWTKGGVCSVAFVAPGRQVK